MRVSAVILAGGTGQRFGSKTPKPFLSLNGKPVIQHSIDVIEPLVDEIIVVADEAYREYKHAPSGYTRQESALNGLLACDDPNFVILHDAVRPLITADTLKEVIRELEGGAECVSSAVPVLDGFIDNGVPANRNGMMLSQTPEGFPYLLLLNALRQAEAAGREYSDCPRLLSRERGALPVIVPGVQVNTKLTYAKDLEYMEGILRFRSVPIQTVPNLYRKNILVLGGSGGIGKACIDALYAHDADVIAPGHDEIDLSREFLIHLGDLDGIIYSAGEYRDESKMLAVNTQSCYDILKSAAAQGWKGNIVFISSTAATYGRKGSSLYSASKAALNAIIEGEHEALAEQGIYINAIAPAKVHTQMAERLGWDLNGLLTPEFVAEKVLRYLDTKVHGHIVYFRNGY